MRDLTPITNRSEMEIPELIDLLKNEPDGVYRIFLIKGKMYQAIKLKGEITTVVTPTGNTFRRAINYLSNSVVAPRWVEFDRLDDINTFLLIAQVKGWI